jgi:hypothetical protein
MTPPHEHAGTVAATGVDPPPRCQCDQQLADSLPLLLVTAGVILLVARLRSWARRRREVPEKAAR